MDRPVHRGIVLNEPKTATCNTTLGSESYRFLIVDDHALIRFGLSLALTQRYAGATVAHATSLVDALRMVQTEPDLTVILYDLRLDDSNPLDGLNAMLKAAGDVPVIVVSGMSDSGTVASCIRIGACAFVPKGCEAATLDQALSMVLSGGIFVPALPVGQGRNPIRIPQPSPAPPLCEAKLVDELSDRQREVLLLLLEGQSNREIADALGVREGTTKVYLRIMMQRFNVRNRTQLVLKVVNGGYFPFMKVA